jgi:hypothetical protein
LDFEGAVSDGVEVLKPIHDVNFEDNHWATAEHYYYPADHNIFVIFGGSYNIFC